MFAADAPSFTSQRLALALGRELAQGRTGRTDGGRVEPELVGDRIQRAIHAPGCRTETGRPCLPAFRGGWFGQRDAHRRQAVRPSRFTGVDRDGAANARQEGGSQPRRIAARLRRVRLDIETSGNEQRLAIPGSGQRLPLGRMTGDIRGAQPERAEAGGGQGRGRDQFAVGRGPPGQGDMLAGLDSTRPGLGRVRQPGWQSGGTGQREHDTLQPFVHALHAGEAVQNSLIDPERTAGQRLARQHFEHAPVAERPVSCERAPMRAGQGRQCQAKCRRGPFRVAVCERADLGEAALQFHSGAQQQKVALEGRQAEQGTQHVEC